jgi:hypothetical protein
VLTSNFCWVYVKSDVDPTEFGTIFYRSMGLDVFHYDNFTYETYRSPIPCEHQITKLVAWGDIVILSAYNMSTGDSDIKICPEDAGLDPITTVLSAHNGSIEVIEVSEDYFVTANE